jgi:replicative DNA helicase
MSAKNTMPASPRAEESVIGAVFLRPSVLAWLEIESGDFSDPRNQCIWDALCDVYENQSHTLDAVLVQAELERRGKLELVGGMKRLADLAQAVPTADNVEFYAGEVVRKRVARQVLLASAKIRELVRNGADGDELLSEMHREFSGIDSRKRVEAVSLFDAAKAELKAVGLDLELGKRAGITTGLSVLDERIGGIPIGVESILAARPSVGKSALALTIGEAAALDGVNVLYFTFEDSISGFAQRALAKHGGVTASRIRSRELGAAEMAQLMAGLEPIRNRQRLTLIRAHGLSVEQLIRRARIERAHANADRFLVIVDYVNLVPASRRGMNDRERVAHTSRALSEFAGSDNVAVLLLAQLNRESEKGDRKPLLSDLRDSGELEQVGKLILMLHDEGESGKLKICCLKNHQGPRADFTVDFDKAHCRVW